MTKRTKTIIWIIVAVMGIALIGVLLSDVISGEIEVSFSELLKMIDTKQVQKVYVDAYNWTAIGVDNKVYVAVGSSIYDAAGIEVIKALTNAGVVVELADPNAGSFLSSILPFLGVVAVALIFWLIMRSASGAGQANMSISKNKAQVQNNLKVRFSDVAGAEEEKEELQEVVEFLKAPKKFSALGARIPSGVLLVGPPGTGKTLFAKAVAGEAGVPFFSVSGSDFVEMYVGVGASRVRDLFEMAKKSQPCIIFIDEIDAVGRRRGAGLGGGHDERGQVQSASAKQYQSSFHRRCGGGRRKGRIARSCRILEIA